MREGYEYSVWAAGGIGSIKRKHTMKTITIEQAAKWLAVSNLGGPFTIHRKVKDLIGTDQGGRAIPLNGKGIEHIYNAEYQNIPEYEEALPAEKADFEKQLRRKKDFAYWSETLKKELGLEIVK